MSGEIVTSSSKETQRQGQRERALAMLHQMIEDAHRGKRQFLSGTCFFQLFFWGMVFNGLSIFLFGLQIFERGSYDLHSFYSSYGFNVSLPYEIVGKLHNLARAVADEETEVNFLKGEGSHPDRKAHTNFDKDGVLGLGLRAIKQIPLGPKAGQTGAQPVEYDLKDSGKRLFGPLSTKQTTYLSQFILHIAAIGDIVDGTDTTHDFNFFSLVFEWPKDVSSIISCIEDYLCLFLLGWHISLCNFIVR